jgi:serine/threonine-protein kinase RsbT
MDALWPSGIPHGDVQVWEIDIGTESEIASVRQRVRELAKQHGFDQFALAALTTAASELSRNMWVHAQGGIARIAVVRRGSRVGLELEFIDHGPGIADVDRAFQEGFSTSKSLGLGLPGTKRLVDEFSIETEPGRGTKVMIQKWKRDF